MTVVTDGRGAGSREVGSLARGVVGPAQVIAFGTSNVAPAGAVVAGLVIVVSYAGFASPLVVLIAFVASLCCASTIAELPAGSPRPARCTHTTAADSARPEAS